MWEFDQQLGWTGQVAPALRHTRCDPDHPLRSMVRRRSDGILAGY